MTQPPDTGPPRTRVFGYKTPGVKNAKTIGILKDAGKKVKELCPEHGICERAFYRWHSKYCDMEVSDARRLR